MFWWNWNPNPSAVGAGDVTYTLQNKPAQAVLTAHWLPLGWVDKVAALTSSTSRNTPSFGDVTGYYGGLAAERADRR